MTHLLATPADVEARLGKPLPVPGPSADALLEEASLVVIAYLGGLPDPDDEWAERTAAVVTSRMVARVIQQAESASNLVGVDSVNEQYGPFAHQVTFPKGTTSGGPWLTAVDKTALDPYRVTGGFSSIPISSGRTGRYRSDDWCS